MVKVQWQSIAVDPKQLVLATVLRCGQSFRWRNVDGIWSMCMQNRVVLLKQDASNLYYASIGGPEEPVRTNEQLVRDYFNLSVDVERLYEDWSKRDRRFAPPLKKESPEGATVLHHRLRGVRILRQDPWETLCAFICSSNNNIKRISKMVDSLCTEFGPFVAEHAGLRYYDFPSPIALAGPGVEQRLRELGFGYRARYIAQTAAAVAGMPDGCAYLESLRLVPAAEAHQELLQFSGVGPKVADCVCLMSLDKHAIVPLDTHMIQIASRDYKIKNAQSPKAYKQVQEEFARIWGEYAGWAHSVLFAGDLSDLNNGINLVTVPTIESARLDSDESVKTEPIKA